MHWQSTVDTITVVESDGRGFCLEILDVLHVALESLCVLL